MNNCFLGVMFVLLLVMVMIICLFIVFLFISIILLGGVQWMVFCIRLVIICFRWILLICMDGRFLVGWVIIFICLCCQVRGVVVLVMWWVIFLVFMLCSCKFRVFIFVWVSINRLLIKCCKCKFSRSIIFRLWCCFVLFCLF